MTYRTFNFYLSNKFLISCVLILITSCNDETRTTFSLYSEPETIVFTGKIALYDSTNHPRDVQLKYSFHEQLEDFQKSFPINEKGEFKCSIRNNIIQDYTLLCGYAFTRFIAFPGDSIHFDLKITKKPPEENVDDLLSTNLWSHMDIQFDTKSDFVDASAKVVNFAQEEVKQYFEKNTQLHEYSLSDTLFDYLDYNQTQFEIRLKSFLASEKIDDVILTDWAKLTYLYILRSEFLMAFIKHMDSLKLDKKASFITTLQREYFTSLNNESGIYPMAYEHFIHHLEIPFQKLQISRHIQYYKEKNYTKIHEMKLEKIDELFSGHSNDVLSARYLHWALNNEMFLKSIDSFALSFMSKVKNPFIKERLNRKFDMVMGEIKMDPQLLSDKIMKIAGENENVIFEILKNSKGKVIVLDFWATWCGPCLSEFKFGYPDFIPKYKKEDVAFVFLASTSPKGLWQKTLSELPFRGEHLLLTDKQYHEMQKLFNITGIPHHVVIDRNGVVISKMAPGPAHGLEEVINRIL